MSSPVDSTLLTSGLYQTGVVVVSAIVSIALLIFAVRFSSWAYRQVMDFIGGDSKRDEVAAPTYQELYLARLSQQLQQEQLAEVQGSENFTALRDQERSDYAEMIALQAEQSANQVDESTEFSRQLQREFEAQSDIPAESQGSENFTALRDQERSDYEEMLALQAEQSANQVDESTEFSRQLQREFEAQNTVTEQMADDYQRHLVLGDSSRPADG